MEKMKAGDRKKIEKAIPSEKEKISEYFNENRNKPVDDSFLTGWAHSMNDQSF